MAKKTKVLHVINNLKIGGAEKILTLLLKELAKRPDLELHLILLEGGGPLVKELPKEVATKIFTYRLFWPKGLSLLVPRFRFSLWNYVRQIQPDIIHGHLFQGEDFAKVLGMVFKKPVVVTTHDTMVWAGRRSRLLNRFLVKGVAVSKPVAKYLRAEYQLPAKKVTVIPNAIDAKLFSQAGKKFNPQKPVFIYIGRLLKLKGIEDAIKGLARLQKDCPKLEFLVYGKAVFPEYLRELKKLVADNQWSFVKFMGPTNDVPRALAKADIFISPSETEGFGMSVLEAAVAGKPVIATKVGAIPEIIKDGVSGFLVEYNQPEQIYQVAKKILDKNLVASFGRQAQKQANQRYDLPTISEQYYQLYQEIIKK